jgi:hypothetical protein
MVSTRAGTVAVSRQISSRSADGKHRAIVYRFAAHQQTLRCVERQASRSSPVRNAAGPKVCAYVGSDLLLPLAGFNITMNGMAEIERAATTQNPAAPNWLYNTPEANVISEVIAPIASVP